VGIEFHIRDAVYRRAVELDHDRRIAELKVLVNVIKVAAGLRI
jgi:hypothetical protein